MTLASNSIRDELMNSEAADNVIGGVLERAWGIIADSTAAAQLDKLHLAVFNAETASVELLANDNYNTANCRAINKESLIIVKRANFKRCGNWDKKSVAFR